MERFTESSYRRETRSSTAETVDPAEQLHGQFNTKDTEDTKFFVSFVIFVAS